jgi:HEAT repeats
VELELLVLSLAGMAIAYLVGVVRADYRAEAWRQAARCAGLTDIREAPLLSGLDCLVGLQGVADGFGVTFTTYRRGKHERGTRIIVDGRGRFPAILDLRAEGLGTAVDRTFGGKELEVGDAIFDAEVYAQGPEEVLLPILDHETRQAVRAVIAQRGHITEGTVRVDVHGWANRNALSSALRTALRAAACLEQPEDAVARLVTHVHNDPIPTFRLRCLDLLARRFPDNPHARAAFRAALHARNEEIRLRAGMALAEEGRETLIVIASDPDAGEALAARAIVALGAHLGPERASTILDAAIEGERTTVALAAIQALGNSGAAVAVSRLTSALECSNTELAVAATRALAAAGGPPTELALLTALESDHGELRLAAAEALGRLGTAAAVPPLHAAVDAHPLDLGLRSAVRQAIAAIHSRAPGASSGQVSLAAAEAGHVSLTTDGPAGGLSITKEDGGAP